MAIERTHARDKLFRLAAYNSVYELSKPIDSFLQLRCYKIRLKDLLTRPG